MTSREQQILDLIHADPLMSQGDIAKFLGISRSAVAGHIMNLTNKGFIKGRGYVFSNAPYIAVVGGANMDIHGWPGSKLRMHDSNPGTVRTSPGGVARNVAENLARLGADCRLVSAVGNDQYGQILLQRGREAGIDMRNVMQFDSLPTSTYLSVLNHTGDMHVAISDMSIIDALDAKMLRTNETMLRQAALIIIDANLGDDALAWLTRAFAEKPLFVDTVSSTKAQSIKPYLDSIHTLKPGVLEAEAISGMRARTPSQLDKLAGWFHEQGVQRLFVTLGDRGVFFSTSDQRGISKSTLSKTRLRNAGGAGDAFLAGLAFSWLREYSLEQSVNFSLAAANIAMSSELTSNPNMSLAAVEHEMENSCAR